MGDVVFEGFVERFFGEASLLHEVVFGGGVLGEEVVVGYLAEGLKVVAVGVG